MLTASRSSATNHYRIRLALGEFSVNHTVRSQSSSQKCKSISSRWNIFLDGFVETGRQLQAGGYSDEVVKQLLKRGFSSCLVVPLIVASLDPLPQGRGTLRFTSLRDNIELGCRGKLSHLSEGRYLFEFSEIKSSFEGKYRRFHTVWILNMLHFWSHNIIIFDSASHFLKNKGAKEGKAQVRRSAMLMRRALSWALLVNEEAFVTKVKIIIPQTTFLSSSNARDFDEEEDETGTKVTVQIVKSNDSG